jgi:superfamily II DNA or RNA helicase
MTKWNQILIELLSGIKNWGDLKVKLEQFNTTQSETTSKKTVAGKIFEVFAKYFFQSDPKQKDIYKTVWLYSEIPNEVSNKLSLPPIDHGIDLLLVDNDDKYYAVQCKFTNDETKLLSWGGDKISHLFGLATKCDKAIVFTNASDTTHVAKGFIEKFIQIAFDELDKIEEELFINILELANGNQPKELKKYEPEDHQIKAINDVINYFEKGNTRTQLILPCGSGKSLTALWINEKLECNNTLVLVPSLALLKQIKNDWARHKNSYFRYLCVCSEKDIDKDRKKDHIEVHTYELGSRVTNHPQDVTDFLKKESRKVVYCTYQSLEVIKEACALYQDFKFDFIVFDEAHRTTGSKKKNIFTLAHYDYNIPANKRMYMTATPKVVDVGLKGRLGEQYQELLCDMSNPEIYGEEAHRLSFGDAIVQKILVDYKIIGIGVTDKQVKKFIDEKYYIGNSTAEDIAHNYALNLVMSNYNAFHCLSFHSLVDNAKAFSLRHRELFPDVYSEYVEGNQTTTYRAKVLRRFKNEAKGVVSNARCLTEGVDVPTIDMIYFCDPKSSKIDIVQATGRALRKDRKENKKVRGLIVIPIFHQLGQDVETEIKKKPIFNYLIQVVRSLCDQDERLESEINELSFKKGQRTSSKIEINFIEEATEKVILEGLEKRIKDVLFDEIIAKTRDYWEVNYMKAMQFRLDFPDKPFPQRFPDDKNFGYWIGNQKRYWEKLSPNRKQRLLDIGFNPETNQDVNTDEEWIELIKDALSNGIKLKARQGFTYKNEDIGRYLRDIKTASKNGKKIEIYNKIEKAGYSFSSASKRLEITTQKWINDLTNYNNPKKLNFRNRFYKNFIPRKSDIPEEVKKEMNLLWRSMFGEELSWELMQERTNDRTDEWKAFRYNKEINPKQRWYQPETKMGSVFSWVYRKLNRPKQMDRIRHNFTETEIIELRNEGFPI